MGQFVSQVGEKTEIRLLPYIWEGVKNLMLKVTEENIKYLFNLGMGKDSKHNTKAGSIKFKTVDLAI